MLSSSPNLQVHGLTPSLCTGHLSVLHIPIYLMDKFQNYFQISQHFQLDWHTWNASCAMAGGRAAPSLDQALERLRSDEAAWSEVRLCLRQLGKQQLLKVAEILKKSSVTIPSSLVSNFERPGLFGTCKKCREQ